MENSEEDYAPDKQNVFDAMYYFIFKVAGN